LRCPGGVLDAPLPPEPRRDPWHHVDARADARFDQRQRELARRALALGRLRRRRAQHEHDLVAAHLPRASRSASAGWSPAARILACVRRKSYGTRWISTLPSATTANDARGSPS